MKTLLKYLHFLPALILAATLPYKFTGNGLPYLYTFFDQLTGGYGHEVMMGIGVQELFVAVGLLLSSVRKYAALAAIATMVGAIATHIYLGQFDAVFLQAFIVLGSSVVLLFKRS